MSKINGDNDHEVTGVFKKVGQVLRGAQLDRTTIIKVLNWHLASVIAKSNLSDDEAANFLEKNTELIIALMRHHRRTWPKHLATN